MTIQSITVENVKGLSSKSFDLEVLPNRPSLLVAPNGFGKSSIAAAFASLNANRINLDEEHCHHGDVNRIPRLLLQYRDSDGTSHNLEANPNINTIAGHFDCFVINNQTKAKGVGKNFGGRTHVSASLTIEPVILIDTIPERQTFDYSYSNQKSLFGNNGKVLHNISDFFQNLQFIESLSNNFSSLDRALGVRVTNRIDDIKQYVNAQGGTSNELIRWITENKVSVFKTIVQIEALADLIERSTLNVQLEAERYLVVLQIIELYKSDKTKFKKACKYNNYKLEQKQYVELLQAFNTSSYDIRPKKKHKKLIVEFPKANRISNGQRDVLSFIALLHRARRKFNKNNCILIIDEIFDYLDDANLVAVQYYTTQLIDEYKQCDKRIYPLILTHLNPYYFKNFTFSKQKEYFLYKSTIQPNPHMVKLLRNRKQEPIKDDVAKCLLHFSTSAINRRSDFRDLGLKETWGESDNFVQYLSEELEKYLDDQGNYDPLAVCCAVRRRIEKSAYDSLLSSEQKAQFLQTSMTKKKLDYAESVGASVPEYFYLLGIIYNDGLHWRENQDNISPIAAKLENLTIRHLIKKIS